MPPGVGVDLLGVQQQRAGQGRQFLAQGASAGDLADFCQREDQPERADGERAPHAAYYSEESITAVRDFAAHEVVRVLPGKPPLSPVNADQLTAEG